MEIWAFLSMTSACLAVRGVVIPRRICGEGGEESTLIVVPLNGGIARFRKADPVARKGIAGPNYCRPSP